MADRSLTVKGGLSLSVRPPAAADHPAILELLKGTVGETESSRKTEAFWSWKHHDGPFGRSYVIAAYDERDDRLVGLRTFMWWLLRDLSGREVRAVRPVDTATSPEYQGKGIFSQLTTCGLEDVAGSGAELVFNTPNQNSLPGYLKMGWKVVARWPLFARPCAPYSPWRWVRSGTQGSTGSGGVRWQEWRVGREEQIEEVVSLHERKRARVGLRTARDFRYLDWRYGGHPDIEYRVFSLLEKERIEGFLVGRESHSRTGRSAFVITEMFLRKPSPMSAWALLGESLRQMPYLYAVAHFAQGTIERKSLRRRGFLRLPGRGYTFTSRALAQGSLDPTLEKSWDLTLGELEIF